MQIDSVSLALLAVAHPLVKWKGHFTLTVLYEKKTPNSTSSIVETKLTRELPLSDQALSITYSQ